MEKKDLFGKDWKFWILPSLLLGLAPFFDAEGNFAPHLFGKLQWIAGGGAFSGKSPMQLMDWGDLLMHSAPLLILIYSFVRWQTIKPKG